MSAPDESPKKRRNLILCSDGTGARASNADGSNVWRIYQALDRRAHDDFEQVAVHDDGVGTSSNKLMAALGGGMGFGLARNVRELYAWLCMQYRQDDHIYLFGFSRGAFTVRCLAGMITRFGVLDATSLSTEELHWQVTKVWFDFKDSQYDKPDSRDSASAGSKPRKSSGLNFHGGETIEFIGVWDTVDAYGLPVDELKEAFAWVSRVFFRYKPLHYMALTRFNDRRLSPKIHNAYHAVAIDDERQTFHPVLWDVAGTTSRWKTPSPGDDQDDIPKNEKGDAAEPNLQQVWFNGMHTDVGGGYARGSLSLVPLVWMMTKAKGHGLVFSDALREEHQEKMSPQGPMHDSRSGTGAYYRYKPRDIKKLCEDHGMAKPVVHESVLQRISALAGEGAPAVLPPDFEVVDNNGEPTDSPLVPDTDCLASLRMLHWRRWVLYFVFLLWTAAVVGLLILGPTAIAGQPAPPWKLLGIGYVMSLLQRLLPGGVSEAVGTLRGLPFWTLSLAAGLAFLGWRRHSLVGQMRELQRAAWNKAFRDRLAERKWLAPSEFGFKLLEKIDRRRAAKEHEKLIAARAVALAVFGLLVFWLYSWAASGVMLPSDFITSAPEIGYPAMDSGDDFSFDTRNPALAIGPVWQRGERYSISVASSGDWADGAADTTPNGIEGGGDWFEKAMLRLLAYRDPRQNVFALLGAVGSENGDTFVIGQGCVSGELSDDTRLFVFVNDRTCYWCAWGGAWSYYADNKGTALITIEPVPAGSDTTGQRPCGVDPDDWRVAGNE